ncbi:MAG: alpha/beta fold hydrolase [Chloroflexi bacterium]|nr:alpha/beta fold hydrolase [Chloroflexota bacterium]
MPPPVLRFTAPRHFQFASPVSTPWPENNIVFGKFYRSAGSWQEKPVALLLHGWNGEWCYRFLFPYLAWRLVRRGMNAAMIELPYHAHRKPRAAGAVRNFISDDLPTMLEATRQALADMQAFQKWCRAQGSPGISLWGFSLGAWLAGLLCCQTPEIERLVLATPVCRLDRAIQALPFCEPVRQALRRQTLSCDQLNLVSHRPQIPPDRILILASQHDLFAPLETVEELWEAWGRPAIRYVPQGHISLLLSLPILEQAIGWVSRGSAE